MKKLLHAATAGVVALSTAHAMQPAATALPVAILSSEATVMRTGPVPASGASAAHLTAVPNEFAAFQLAVSAPDGDLDGLTVTLDKPLQRTESDGRVVALPADVVRIYREAYYDTGNRPASVDGRVRGGWPDALIPAVDQFYHERRNAFPTTVKAGENQGVWVDVFAPPTATGIYDGTLTVSATGRPDTTIRVELSVAGTFVLPSTPSLPSLFDMGSLEPCQAFFAGDDCATHEEDGWRLNALFAQSALDNRITIANPMYSVLNQAGAVDAFTTYDLPLLTGQPPGWGVAPPTLTGAKLTSLKMVPDNARKQDLGIWHNLATTYGFTDRLVMYAPVCDEIHHTHKWSECKTALDAVRRDWPDRTLVTTWISATDGHDGLLDDIDILATVPQVYRSAAGTPLDEARYNAWLADPRKQAWIYTGCNSHGCDDLVCAGNDPNCDQARGHDPALYNGWPDYVIDQPASQVSAMGWLTFINQYDPGYTRNPAYRGGTGLLYYETTLKLASAWTDQYQEGGHGDGTLFYPGVHTDARIGGTHDIPIESMRLKRIRDGVEDYECLKYLADHGNGGLAANIAESLFPAYSDTARSEARMDRARDVLRAAVSGGTTPGYLSLTRPVAFAPKYPDATAPVTVSFTALNDGLRDYSVGFLRIIVSDRTKPSGSNYVTDILEDNPPSTVVVKPWQTHTFQGTVRLPAGHYTAYATTSAYGITDSRPVDFDVYPSPGHLALTTSLTIARKGTSPDDPVEARFTVTNDGAAPIDVPTLFVGARGPNNQRADFPGIAPFTLAPGESREYVGTRSLAPGRYTAAPTEEIDANTYPQLEPAREFVIP